MTPKSYLELIGFYKARQYFGVCILPFSSISLAHTQQTPLQRQYLLIQKRGEAARQIDRLDVGLATLRKTVRCIEEDAWIY